MQFFGHLSVLRAGKAQAAASVSALALLTAACPLCSQAQKEPPDIRFRIDAAQRRTPISPLIYGTNQADKLAKTKGLTLTRIGGNRMTAYNWENNASNAGNDYRFQNDGFLDASDTPGDFIRKNVQIAFASGASIIVTVPMAGYVSADKNGDGDVNKTPDYLRTRFNASLPRKGKPFVNPPDLADKTVYQDEFVWWLEHQFPGAHGKASSNLFYCLDNEPDIWGSTHARLRPRPLTYAEMLTRSVEYSAAIKAVAPNALIFGPVSYGWQGYQTLQNAPDANGRNFLDVYLDGMREAEKTQGKRLLDVLDVHWYPEAYGGGKRVSDQGSAPPALVEARLQAPRSLWDATYREDSWIAKSINQPIRLLPRLKEQIAHHYPGTKLALTEYNYGGAGDISGAIAQSDVLGIFGREGVFAACYWPLGSSDAFVYGAFAMFRDYDGKGARFGDTSVLAETSDTARTSVYAAVDSANPRKIVIVALNKTNDSLPVDMALAGSTPVTQMDVYRLTREAPLPHPEGQARIVGKHLITTLPPMSVTTFAAQQ